ncbi:hypothetical protein CPB85DRAFT_1434393 [Mucidula mucida]|nr:hypothetical protein CPB85DRAFT_1434393 [Mucidula mucida]
MAGHYYYRSLDALLATDSQQLVSQPLTFSRTSSKTLGDAFQDERIWFNHCICVDDYDPHSNNVYREQHFVPQRTQNVRCVQYPDLSLFYLVADQKSLERAPGGDIRLSHASQSPYLSNNCWTLSSVCRSWHYVATHFPRLWRDMTVPVRILAARCSDPVAFLSLIVSRADALDLFITFDARPVYDTVNNLSELALALLNVLMERAMQWHTLRLFKLDMSSTRALGGVHDMLSRLIEHDIYTVVGDYYDSSLVDMLCQGRIVKRMVITQPQKVPFRFDSCPSSAASYTHSRRHSRYIAQDRPSLSPQALSLPACSLKLINCNVARLVEILEVVPHLQDLIIIFEVSLPESMAFVSGVDQALLARVDDWSGKSGFGAESSPGTAAQFRYSEEGAVVRAYILQIPGGYPDASTPESVAGVWCFSF